MDGHIDGIMDQAKQGARNLGEAGAAAFNTAAQRGAEFKRAVVQSGEQALAQTDSFIRDNPRSSVLYAFGAGIFIAGLSLMLLELAVSPRPSCR